MNIFKNIKKKTAPIVLAGGLAATLLTGCGYKILSENARVVSNEKDVSLDFYNPKENYLVNFRGEIINFSSNNIAIYNQFELGEIVRITYKEDYLLGKVIGRSIESIASEDSSYNK
jgi:hypothetical protein